jgi:hypothetical protein
MKKVVLAGLTAMSIVAVAPAATAGAATGPCASQRALFEKYNIQTDMDAPLVGYAYNEVCAVTG